MVEPLQYDAIIRKLFEKTQIGRVPWEITSQDEFKCALDGKYQFNVYQTEDGFGLRMSDEYGRKVFSVSQEEEIVFREAQKREMFEMLRDLYELARRKALNVPEKIATVSNLLDRI